MSSSISSAPQIPVGIKTNQTRMKLNGQTIQEFESVTYAHIKRKNNPTGGFKTCKTAEVLRGDNQGEIVARLNMKYYPKSKNSLDIVKRHIHYTQILPILNSIPGVVKTHHYIQTKNKRQEEMFVYYQDYYSHDLKSHQSDPASASSLTELKKDEIALVSLTSLHQLHEAKIFHRDIKPENVLVDLKKKTSPIAAICDFDFAYSREAEKEKINQICGTPLTLAPERAEFALTPKETRGDLTENELAANDVWGMGLVLFYLYHNKYPNCIKDLNQKNVTLIESIRAVSKLKNHKKEVFSEPPKDTKMHIIWKMLQPDPEKRISAKEALDRFKAIPNLNNKKRKIESIGPQRFKESKEIKALKRL